MTFPRHLWTGNWRQESEDARPEHPTAVQMPPGGPVEPEPEPEPAPPDPTGPGRPPLRLVAAFVLPLVVAGAIVIAIAGRSDNGSSNAAKRTVASLPAQTTPAPKPKGTDAEAIYASAGPAVASIRTSSGSGTGFLVTDNRTLVTNAHVVESAKQVRVRFGPSGRDLIGQVAGSDPSSDLAVVKLVSGAPPADAKPLTLADSDRAAVGQTVVAIGNPFGLDRTVTQGIISALGREIQAPNGFAIENALQTDAAINPGNSGGPLLDTLGRVVGVNSQIETGGSSTGNVGIGFAVPSNSVRRIAPQLAAGKTVEHAWLGVETSGASSTGGAPAARVQRVVAGGPASAAGVQVGDVITAIDGRAVSAFNDIAKAVDAKNPGDHIAIEIDRGGSSSTIQVKLGTRPQQVP